jgi:hypothetical protein
VDLQEEEKEKSAEEGEPLGVSHAVASVANAVPVRSRAEK